MLKFEIDAGHGNNTAGKRAPDDSMREHHFNASVARYLDAELAKYENVQTAFSHDPSGMIDIPLKTRTDKANAWKADCFVSIHANAFKGVWGTHGGIDTFVYVTKPKEAVELATKVQANLIKETGLRNRGVKAENFHVLRESKMTAILCECGFMDNKEELALLKSDAYRRKCAKAIADGLAAHYKLKLKPVSAPKPAPPSTPGKLHRVQLGAFSDRKNAEKLAAELKAKGYAVYITDK